MKTLLHPVLLIILSGLAIGCSASYTVSSIPGTNSRSLQQVNDNLDKETALIILNSGEQSVGRNILIRGDSTFWTETSKHSCTTVDIRKIQLKNRSRGALEGFLLGTMGGAMLLGLDAGVLSKGDENPIGPAVILTGVAVLMVPVGLAVGIGNGH